MSLKTYLDEFTPLGKWTLAPLGLVCMVICVPLLLCIYIAAAPIYVIEWLIVKSGILKIGLKIKRLFVKEPYPGFDKI